HPLHVKVKPGRTRRSDLSLRSAAGIHADVRPRKRKVKVDITVTERGTGVPATGAVRLSTSLFSTELPLVRGRTTITLLGSTGESDGAPEIGSTLEVDYLGDKHSAPASTTAHLR
ncbi:MAG: hypothetical protein JWP31_753, partial [Aeromicrobium sp.]|nr:hypothetical protein [Aeromicrobium sp.]